MQVSMLFLQIAFSSLVFCAKTYSHISSPLTQTLISENTQLSKPLFFYMSSFSLCTVQKLPLGSKLG